MAPARTTEARGRFGHIGPGLASHIGPGLVVSYQRRIGLSVPVGCGGRASQQRCTPSTPRAALVYLHVLFARCGAVRFTRQAFALREGYRDAGLMGARPPAGRAVFHHAVSHRLESRPKLSCARLLPARHLQLRHSPCRALPHSVIGGRPFRSSRRCGGAVGCGAAFRLHECRLYVVCCVALTPAKVAFL